MPLARAKIRILVIESLVRILVLLGIVFFNSSLSFAAPTKVKPTTLVVSLEGEATVYNIKDDFEVTLTSKSIGKKIDSQSIIKTEK
ncbi:MAG: hypothetical protein CBD35_01765, partial [Verrucomicrobia bacterium TMED175]